VPSKRAQGERRLEDALAALASALDESGAPWMVIGGIAVIAHGVRRFTTDIDAAVLGNAVDVERLLEVLARHEIVPRIPDAAAFARANLVLLLRHAPTGVDLDVSQTWSSFEQEALSASKKARFGRVRVPMSAPDDLVVFKAIAGRPKDIEDAEALLVLHPQIDVTRARHRVAELAALAEAPELVASFDVMVKRARGAQDKPAETTSATGVPRKSTRPRRRPGG
jgi:hypothetical protein